MSAILSHEQLKEIAEQFGTPVYVYHAEQITAQYQRLTDAFSGMNTTFFYASKALTNLNILKHIRNIGCNVDCSSLNEALLAAKAGFAPQQILYTSNNVDFNEIVAAATLGAHINIDSISNLQKFADKYGSSYPVGIRLRPNIMAGGNLKISTGHNKSKFGIPVENVNEVVDLMKKTGVKIKTLHIHTGSEIKDVEVFAKGIEILFELVPLFPDLEVIDLGGGFKVPYLPGEKGTDINLLAEKVKEEFDALETRTGKKLRIWFEPGKFLVSEAGYFVTQVTVLKESGDIRFAGINSGLNHLIRPMFYGSYHHIENISNNNGPELVYNVVGNICETDDFAEDRPLHKINEGDYLAFYNAGAYGIEMASNYNSRFKPAEVLVKNGQYHLIRRRDTIEDLLQTQVILED